MMKSVRLTVSTVIPALKKLAVIALAALPVLAISWDASAGGNVNLTGYATAVGGHTNKVVDIINYIAFTMGAISIGLGLSDVRKTVENGSQHPWKNGIIKLFVGGLFLSLPFIIGIVSGTMKGGAAAYAISMVQSFAFSQNNVTGGIGSYINRGITQAGVLVSVAAFLAFIIGTFFTVRGIQLVRNHVENPGQAPLPEGIKRLAVGGALLSFPMIVNVIAKTFGVRGAGLGNSGWSSTGGNAAGLDGMMVRFIADIANPAFQAIEFFCYISGILLILFGLQRLVRTAQDGPRGPLTFGTITMFVVAGALLSFPQLLTSLNLSLTGTGGAKTQVLMSMTGVDAAQVQNAKNVFSAILAFMAVIGFLSVVRGLFLLKSFADGGQQASMMSVVTHIVAGSLCINLGAFLNAVQSSLGVTTFPVTFN